MVDEVRFLIMNVIELFIIRELGYFKVLSKEILGYRYK